MPTAPPPAAAEHYATSALIAAQAVRAAGQARPRGLAAIASTIIQYQAANALEAQSSVTRMLAQQDVQIETEALLNTVAFTTEIEQLTSMVEATGGAGSEFDRLVAALVQDAGRAAESVSVATRPSVRYVRYLNLPSCSRCAVLAGRVYSYSQGFERHPNCDCVMLPTTVAAPDLIQDPVELLQAGQIRGLSKADVQAIADGADFSRVANVRSAKAGLRQSGRVLARRGRPTPEAIYATTSTREEAVAALKAAGYIR